MPTPSEWQKVRPERFTAEEWEKLREMGFKESYIIIFKNIWALIMLFATFVLGALSSPQVNSVADWIRNFLS